MHGWLKRISDPRFASWIGMVAPFYTIFSIVVSIALSPWFSWTHNALSDLGVSPVAPIFNSGLIVGGILSSLFSIALARAERQSLLCLVGSIILLLASLFLACIGIFPESSGRLHFHVSVAFFVLLLIASITLGIGFMLREGTKLLGFLSLSVGILGILSWTAIRFPGVAIPEALSAFPAAILLFVLGLRLRRLRDSG
ncbi:MAG: DUF998 domain-containing protein [Candidatus Bathyarchaeia archaeon]